MKVLIGSHEGLLNHIFGIIPTAAHLVGKPVYERAVSFKQLFERPILTLTSASHKSDIRIQFYAPANRRSYAHNTAFYHALSSPMPFVQ